MPRRASASSALPAVVAVTTAAAPANSTTPTAGQAATATAATASGSSSGGGPSSKTLSAASQAGPSVSAPSASASGSNMGGANAAPARPRRVMPSRSRRGGPGVGISDVDTHILETLRRRRENDPLIPAHARLLLTTNSTRVRTFGDDAAEGSEDPQSNLNTSAYERYFDKPEVIRAYREQQLIQTPEFTLLSEGEAVGGRFRPRSLEDEGIDTSDAAYEKRHRKYEAFEKRQRLREKEKLKHEHYKLKERIEQLRALEPSSFLGAPESFFTNSRRQQSNRGEHDAQGGTDAPEPSSHNEGEWRKRQMLDVANSLDARYRSLLETAPSRAPDLPTPTPPPQLPPSAAAASAAPIPTTPQAPTPSCTPNAVARRSPAPTNTLVLRPPQHTPLSPQTDVIELDSDGDEKAPESVKVESVSAPALPIVAPSDSTDSLKLRIRFPKRRPPTSTSPRVDQRPPSPSSSKATAALAASSPKLSASPSPTRPRPKPIFKNPAAPPGPYARVPFAKRLTSQDVAESPSPLSSTPSSLHAAAAAPSPSTSTTLPTLRRRPSRAVAHGKSGSLTTTIGLSVLCPPHVHVDGSSRPHKRPRVELYDEEEEEESPGLETDDEEVVREIAEEEEEEEEEDEAGEDGRGQRGRESRRERWRECALYREAQRHAGAPSGRKTHRHLGIFGLKGFPAEVEHLRDFVPPRWALPREDPRVVQQADELERERERERERGVGRRDGVAARGAERVRGGATGGGGGGGGGGAMGGGEGGGDGVGVWQRRLRDPVAVPDVTEDGEESCRKSDQMVLIETASTVDSQATEVMI